MTQMEVPDDIPHPILRDLIEQSTRRNPKDRPSFEHILKVISENEEIIKRDGNPWFNKSI